MKTITVKVKLKMLEVNKTKTVKVLLEFPDAALPCFSEIVDEVYRSHDPKLMDCFINFGYVIGVEPVFN
ncbi:hypothetical protein ACMSDU_22470 [Bacteroides thetaiotaomicron]|uniref:hypothetical protein n=1 Tax=Bacteroides thetaiotaomicron TaxID=818 RepID=UPI0039C4E229